MKIKGGVRSKCWQENFMLHTYVPYKVHTLQWYDARTIMCVGRGAAHLFRKKKFPTFSSISVLCYVILKLNFRCSIFGCSIFHSPLCASFSTFTAIFPLNFRCCLDSFTIVVLPQARISISPLLFFHKLWICSVYQFMAFCSFDYFIFYWIFAALCARLPLLFFHKLGFRFCSTS